MPGPRSHRVPLRTVETREGLGQIVRSPSLPAGLVRRARSVLLAAEGGPLRRLGARVGVDRNVVRDGLERLPARGRDGLRDLPRPGRARAFPPGGELPAEHARSLSPGDGAALARQLERDGLVAAISAATVRRVLARQRLKPWRSHAWLHPRAPRDAAFAAAVREVADLLTRPRGAHERVLSLDERTSLQPRPRRVATRPARPGRPRQVAQEYQRKGAGQRFAAVATRSGVVSGCVVRRKRPLESLTLVEHRDRMIPPEITPLHLLADNVSVHHGKLVRRGLADQPRFVAHFTPVHCSWLNPSEPWFSILRRKRLPSPNFADGAALTAALDLFIAQENERAHPCAWPPASFDQILSQIEAAWPIETPPRRDVA